METSSSSSAALERTNSIWHGCGTQGPILRRLKSHRRTSAYHKRIPHYAIGGIAGIPSNFCFSFRAKAKCLLMIHVDVQVVVAQAISSRIILDQASHFSPETDEVPADHSTCSYFWTLCSALRKGISSIIRFSSGL